MVIRIGSKRNAMKRGIGFQLLVAMPAWGCTVSLQPVYQYGRHLLVNWGYLAMLKNNVE
jgi:hypothetical protein